MGSKQQFRLKWNSYGNNLASAFGTLYETESLADVTLFCEGEIYKAHKVVLAVCSKHFQDLFERSPASQNLVLILDGTTSVNLRALLQFMYKGEVYVEENNLSSFLRIAETLQVRGLSMAHSSIHEATASNEEKYERDRDFGLDSSPPAGGNLPSAPTMIVLHKKQTGTGGSTSSATSHPPTLAYTDAGDTYAVSQQHTPHLRAAFANNALPPPSQYATQFRTSNVGSSGSTSVTSGVGAGGSSHYLTGAVPDRGRKRHLPPPTPPPQSQSHLAALASPKMIDGSNSDKRDKPSPGGMDSELMQRLVTSGSYTPTESEGGSGSFHSEHDVGGGNRGTNDDGSRRGSSERAMPEDLRIKMEPRGEEENANRYLDEHSNKRSTLQHAMETQGWPVASFAQRVPEGNEGSAVQSAEGKKLKCPFCDRLYGYETNLRAHIRQRHQGIRVPCPFCTRTFTRNNTVRRHIAREHRGLLSVRGLQPRSPSRVQVSVASGHHASQVPVVQPPTTPTQVSVAPSPSSMAAGSTPYTSVSMAGGCTQTHSSQGLQSAVSCSGATLHTSTPTGTGLFVSSPASGPGPGPGSGSLSTSSTSFSARDSTPPSVSSHADSSRLSSFNQ